MLFVNTFIDVRTIDNNVWTYRTHDESFNEH